jgi:hypothetical protein
MHGKDRQTRSVVTSQAWANQGTFDTGSSQFLSSNSIVFHIYSVHPLYRVKICRTAECADKTHERKERSLEMNRSCSRIMVSACLNLETNKIYQVILRPPSWQTQSQYLLKGLFRSKSEPYLTCKLRDHSTQYITDQGTCNIHCPVKTRGRPTKFHGALPRKSHCQRG